ncbi:jg673 [Pararge aegeria aegeria]|uniref:Jg673 protein n=1 Tax=Pararge aegeria aegeria TaxID=348720 RepID=A0A8S4QM62_9NEOP|nr:jg673 [Pararge aegeria aegeria]
MSDEEGSSYLAVTTVQVQSPTVSNLRSPCSAPSPAATTRSKKALVIKTKVTRAPAKRLEPMWRFCKFTGSAEIDDNNSFQSREEKNS